MPDNTPAPGEGGVDPNVSVPASVKRAAAAADAIHAQAYQTPPSPAATPQPDIPGSENTPQPDAAPAAAAAAPTPPAPAAPARASVPETGEAGSWEHRYHAMKGRYDQSQMTIGSMQEQMAELGDELVRVQSAIDQQPRRSSRQDPVQDPPPAHRRLTQQDMETYGPELTDFVRRAALEAVEPALQSVADRTNQVSQQVVRTSTNTLYQSLDRDVPTWREINLDPRFKVWCSSRDVYSGAVRGVLLKAAFQAADAPRVAAFFKGFLAEEQATGHAPAPAPQQQDPGSAPRTAAVPLETLTAPGRAKPAPGEQPGSADKPVFTRYQVQQFYANVRRGAYVGRDQDKVRDETAIFAAQRDGRIRG